MSRSRKILIIIAVLAMIALPVSNVLANHYFDDVPTSAFYHNSVTAISNAGITSGCSSTNYCPNSAVTRGQMAVFLDRVGNLRDEKGPVVDALTVAGQQTTYTLEDFSLTGTPGKTECRTSLNGVPPFSELMYAVTAHLYDAPVSTSEINVSIEDSDPEDEEFDVCFTAVVAATLPVGDYATVLGLTLEPGSGIFAGGAEAAAVRRMLESWKL